MINILFYVLSFYIFLNIVEPKISSINEIFKKDSILKDRINQEKNLTINKNEILNKLKDKKILIDNFDNGFCDKAILDAICISKGDLSLKKIANDVGVKDLKVFLPKDSFIDENLKIYNFDISFFASGKIFKDFLDTLQKNEIFFHVDDLEYTKNDNGYKIKILIKSYQLVEEKK